MIPTLGAEEVLQTLAGFEAYAAGTLMMLELAGTFVFALSGAAAGVKHRLDLFGVLVVSCATAPRQSGIGATSGSRSAPGCWYFSPRFLRSGSSGCGISS